MCVSNIVSDPAAFYSVILVKAMVLLEHGGGVLCIELGFSGVTHIPSQALRKVFSTGNHVLYFDTLPHHRSAV